MLEKESLPAASAGRGAFLIAGYYEDWSGKGTSLSRYARGLLALHGRESSMYIRWLCALRIGSLAELQMVLQVSQ